MRKTPTTARCSHATHAPHSLTISDFKLLQEQALLSIEVKCSEEVSEADAVLCVHPKLLGTPRRVYSAEALWQDNQLYEEA